MKNDSSEYLYSRLCNKKEVHPLAGHIELTYRCDLDCIYCYCKGLENKGNELSTAEFKKIIDEIHKEGCVWLTLTGGDPLVRDDFLDIYSYAKDKGFIVIILTNGQHLSREVIDYLAKSPPSSIEITLNGITPDTYNAISRVKGSFSRVIETLEVLTEKKLPLEIKTNCLKQNKHEVFKIKKFVEKLLGKRGKNRYLFHYDPVVYPRLNGDTEPINYRLSFDELLELRRQDPEIWEEYQKCLHGDFPDLERDKSFLYHCDTWTKQFFINPYGKLKFCQFSDKFSVDLKKTSFIEGFYRVFPGLLNERFKTDSKCRDCGLRPICYHCPARAYLETGDEEAPVEYYCELANETMKRDSSSRT